MRWEAQHKKMLTHIHRHLKERGRIEEDEDEEEAEEDYLPEELLKKVEVLKEEEYDIPAIVQETILDLDQLAVFIGDLMDIKNREDDKLKNLIRLLREDPLLKENKVIIFSEYITTAKYLQEELLSAGFEKVDEVDSSTKRDRGEIINAFSPYYNDLSSPELAEGRKEEIRILVSTDVLSEGLNLQDATLLINYDLHWNPVRLMQRIGRVDRRLDKEVEERMLSDHPNLKDVRGVVRYWNFLPPSELNVVLSLYEKVTKKTLLISKTFGIEGKKLLTPEDDYSALKEFNQAYEGTPTLLETMHLEYQELIKGDETLPARLRDLPLKIFSGKAHPAAGAKAVFFCYSQPGKDKRTGEWTEDAGFTRWYLYDINTRKILEEPTEILGYIQCNRDTAIKQIRPLTDNQPWGLFYIEFEPKKLPVVVLRRILRALIHSRRHADDRMKTWALHDLIFISSLGEVEERKISFAHFSESEQGLPELRAFSWDERDTYFHYLQNTLDLEKLRWPASENDSVAWREQWSAAFTLRHRYVPTTSKQLAIEMARLAAQIRDQVKSVYDYEIASGPLHKLFESFKKVLIYDLEVDTFTDMYAQTIAYGLFSAKATHEGEFAIEDISAMIPTTNPFLRNLFEECTRIGGPQRDCLDLEELGVTELVKMLKEVNIEAILQDFGRQKKGEDPVIHFYEDFLREYDPKQKVKRGVFYTPDSVVSFIVRSVDYLLRTEFGCQDGLADTSTIPVTYKNTKINGEVIEEVKQVPKG